MRRILPAAIGSFCSLLHAATATLPKSSRFLAEDSVKYLSEPPVALDSCGQWLVATLPGEGTDSLWSGEYGFLKGAQLSYLFTREDSGNAQANVQATLYQVPMAWSRIALGFRPLTLAEGDDDSTKQSFTGGDKKGVWELEMVTPWVYALRQTSKASVHQAMFSSIVSGHLENAEGKVSGIAIRDATAFARASLGLDYAYLKTMPPLDRPVSFDAHFGYTQYFMTGSFGRRLGQSESGDFVFRHGVEWSASFGVANVRLTYRDGYSWRKEFSALFPAMLSIEYVTGY